MSRNPIDADAIAACKSAAASAAVAEIVDGMLVGLGTGTTMEFAITAIRRRVAEGLRVTTVATSLATARIAEAAGLRVLAFDTITAVDLAIDGVDEIDGDLRAIKGKGGAMLREKIVAEAATRMIAIADFGKQVVRLGSAALPVEVLGFGAGFVTRRIEALGATVLRRAVGGIPYRTDQDNAVLDCHFGIIEHPAELAAILAAIPGVLGHGLFLNEIDTAYIGRTGGTLCLTRTAP